MKNILICLIFLLSCKKPVPDLVGTKRDPYINTDPYGMMFVPLGSFHMGPSDQDINYSMNSQKKSVSVQSFYIDETEITNDEYRQFVFHVKDSLGLTIMGEQESDKYLIDEGEYTQRLDWSKKIPWNNEDYREELSVLFLEESDERFYRRKEIDARKLNFEYWWIDFKKASTKENRYTYNNISEAQVGSKSWEYGNGIKDRSEFIYREVVNIYPDTLCWIHDFTYSWNEPMTQMYFWHPTYDHYPVVGVTWEQAKAFCVWRTRLYNTFLESKGLPIVNDFRLPTESEWEYAARGGMSQNPYPWGGPYIRNSKGCFLGNFKPMRGNYTDDGGFHTIIVAHYWPNGFGVYDMAGNVSEWTSNAFDESSYNFSHDLNMDYIYLSDENDAPALKRKVIRGGSWKDIGYYIQNGTRTYEYKDTAKSYVGFRCVQTYLGRIKNDGRESHIY
jgi:formylglycine-generating enzyme required for sulfatase activity